jgi:hypothetical protein
MSKDLFVGTWKLLSSEMRTSTGEVLYPLGEDCAGLLIFDAAGTLSAHLMRQGRPNFVSGDLLRGTDDEIKAAYQGYVGFWGNYEVDEAKREMTYVITGSLFPNWVGHKNLRYYEFDADRLTLRTPQFLMAGTEMAGVLIWQRVC